MTLTYMCHSFIVHCIYVFVYSFDDFNVLGTRGTSPTPAPGPGPLPPPPPRTGCAPSITSGQRLYVGGCAANSTEAHQSWIVHASGNIALTAEPKLCIGRDSSSTSSANANANANANAAGKCSGECLALVPCAGSNALDFTRSSQGKYEVSTNGKATSECLDVDAVASDLGGLELYQCNNKYRAGANQRFDFDEATGIFSSELYPSEASCVVVCGA